VENQAFWFQAKSNKTYRGLCIAVRGQAYVFGASLRGFFWRFGAATYTPKPGYRESIFALRTKILIKVAMADELVPVEVFPISFNRNRSNRIRSTIRVSKHGLLNFAFSQMDASLFPQMDSKILEGFTDGGAENLDEYYDNDEE
jgi:hypothetical protein